MNVIKKNGDKQIFDINKINNRILNIFESNYIN